MKTYIIFTEFEIFSKLINESISNDFFNKILITDNPSLSETCRDHYSQIYYFESISLPIIEKLLLEINKDVKIEGIFGYNEKLISFYSKMRVLLGITTGLVGDESVFFRNKIEMKKRIERYTDINLPRFKKIYSYSDIDNFLDDVASKAILKPIEGTGSCDTYVITTQNKEKIKNSLDIIDLQQYEIEEYISGDMFHVDSITYNGEILFSSVGKYLDSTLNWSKGNCMIGNFFPDHEDLLIKRILETNKKVIDSLPQKNGVTHLELFVSDDHRITFCEIAARIPGAGLIFPIENVTGINLLREGTASCLGLVPDFSSKYKRFAHGGYVLLYRKVGTIKYITEAEDFKSIPAVSDAIVLYKAGDYCSNTDHSGDVAGIVFWKSESYVDNSKIAKEIISKWKIEIA